MQEDAEQYFLSTKARFQISEDAEDAAELYFAAHNLANHGHEVEWDSTLEKMQDLLKEKGAKTEAVSESDVGVGEKGSPPPLPRGGSDDDDPSEDKSMISIEPFRHRRSGVTAEGRHKSVEWHAPANALEPSFGKSGRRRTKHERGWNGDIPKVSSHIYSDSDTNREKNVENLAEAIANRSPEMFNLEGVGPDKFALALLEELTSRPDNFEGGQLDSFGAARLFIENSRVHAPDINPVTYDVWRDEFSPDSPHHVYRSDKARDKMDRETIENSLSEGLLEGKSEEAKAKIMSQASENLLHLSDDSLGVGHDMARVILFHRGFKIWDNWYKETYPDSPLLQDGEENLYMRQHLCLEHKYLKMDGCPLSFIRGVLYDEDGDMSPHYKNNPQTAYLELTQRKWLDPLGGDDLLTYDDCRDKSWALGDQGWLRGFDLLDFDPREDNCNEALTARELYHTMVRKNMAKHKLEEEIPAGDKEVFWRYADILGPEDIFPGHFTEREAMAYMQRAMLSRGEALAAFWTSPTNVTHQNITSETISRDAKIYERKLSRALRDAHKISVSKDELKAMLREQGGKVSGTKGELIERLKSLGINTGLEDGRIHTGPQPMVSSLMKFFGDEGWDFQSGLPLGCKPKNAADVANHITQWLDSGALTTNMVKQLWERLDLYHSTYGDPTNIFSSRKHEFARSTQDYHSGLKPKDEEDVDVEEANNNSEYYHRETTGQTVLLRYLLAMGGLAQTIEQPLYNFAVRNPFEFMELGEEHQMLSDMPKEIPEDSPLGKEIAKVRKDKLGVYQIKDSTTDDLRILRRVAHLLEPEYEMMSTESSDEPGEDIVAQQGRKELTLDSLIYNAKRARWGEMLAYPDEISERIASGPKEYDPSDGGAYRLARIRNRGEPHHGDVVPVTPLAAAVYSRRLSPDSAGKLHRVLTELGLSEPSGKIQRMHGVMLDNATLGFIGGANSGHATIDHTLGTHTRGEHQNNKDINRIHSPANMRESPGDGSVGEAGGMVSTPLRASHSYGWRDKAGVVADEHILRHAQAVLTAHLHGYNHCPVMRFGRDSVDKLKHTTYPNPEGLMGKAVIQEPRAFQEILRRTSKLTDVPSEFRFLKSPFFDDGDFANFWSMMLSSKVKGEQPTEESWRERVESEKHFYPLQSEGGKYYLDMEQIPNQNLYLPPEEGSIHWRAATATPDSKKWSEWMEENPAIDGGTLSPLSFRPTLSPSKYGSLRPTSYDLKDEATRAVLASQSRLEVNKQHIMDVDGVPMLLGEHPSELKGQWAEEVLGRIPLPPQLRGLPKELLSTAQEELRAYVPSPEGIDDSVEYRSSRAGLTKGMVMETVRDEHNTKSAVAAMFHLIVARDAKKHADRYPEFYEDYEKADGARMSPSEIFDEYFSNHIELTDGLGEIEERRREHNQDLIKRACLTHLSDMRHDNIDNLIAEHEEFLGDDFSTHSVGEKYVNDILRAALKETPLGVNDKILRVSEAGGTEDPGHPMRRLMRERGDRQALGHEILRHYILGDSRVESILKGLGMTVEGALGALSDIVESVGEPKEGGTMITNIGDMKRVAHHAGNKAEPLDWWEEALDEHLKGEKEIEIQRKRNLFLERKGFDAPEDWGGHYIPGKEVIAKRQGAYARQAMELRERWAALLNGSQWDRREVADEIHFLLASDTTGNSILDIIRSDLNKFKTSKTAYAKESGRPHFSFPEHRHSIGHSADYDNSVRNLAHFLFCEGRTELPGKSYDIIKPSPGFEEKKLPFGLRFVDKSRKYVTDYGKKLFSGTSDTVDMGGSSFSSFHNNPLIQSWLGSEHTTENGQKGNILREPMTNEMVDPSLPALDTRSDPQPHNVDASVEPVDKLTSLDVLTDIDLLLKEEDDKGKEKGDPLPIKAMHRIFTLKDLEHLRGFSGDWVVSSWPEGNRLMVRKKKDRIQSYNHTREAVTLPNKVKEGLKDSFDKGFLLDCVWDGDVLHIVDILESGKEKMDNSPTKDRNRHLRTNFSATEEVSIPAPINTKRVDSEGLERAIEDLFKEAGTKQILLRDADATCMRGEIRHPKWVMLTPEHQIDVRVIYSRGGKHCLGIGPILTEDALEIGNRARKFNGEHYMDVGKLKHSVPEKGDYITVKITGVSARKRNGLKIYTLQSPRYLKNSESGATDSIDSLEIIQNKRRGNLPHRVRVKKGSIHIDSSVGHVVYDTEPEGHAFILKDADAPNDYVLRLVESQVEYWEPLAAVLLRAEAETKKEKKANVVPEPPANHDKKPKKVLKPSERLLKDPKLTKQLTTALETLDAVLKEKITWTGPKGMGIDYATPVESPSGPTKLTEPHHLPDHDPGHRQKKGGDCWCGAKKGQLCAQGMGHKMEQCPEAHPPKKEKKSRHLRVSRDS